MRVVHFAESFSPVSETFIYDYVDEMKRQGVDCHVLTLKRVDEEDRPFSSVEIVQLPQKWSFERLSRKVMSYFAGEASDEPRAWPMYRRQIKKHLVRLKPDAVHAQFGPAGVLIAPVTRALGIPLVVSFHGYDIGKLPHDPFWREQYKGLFETADLLTGVSNYLCEKLALRGADQTKIALLQNGVRLSQFEYSDPVSRFDGRRVRCIHVGRLVEKKAPILLVEAFHRALQDLPEGRELELIIVGDGPLRGEVHRRIEELNLSAHVEVLGAVPHRRIAELMRDSHIYTQHCITASDGDQEGQGVSFTEASAMGLPIVATRHNGIPDVVLHGKTGYLVEEGDVEGMASRILEFVQNPFLWTQFGAAGRRHVEANFSLTTQVAKAVELIRDISQGTAIRAPLPHRD
jgi:colanic acid/amylovoran biosynthesis glycosyltransferase